MADEDVPLTESGKAQARITGHVLKQSYGTFDYVYHSGYRRTVETVDEMLKNYTDLERIGQLQYEILRTLRVIVDISIHAVGIPPTEIIDFMKKHLAMPDKTIESEVYRYVTIPGQALCYKLGCEIFRKIYKKYGGNNYTDKKSFDLYKKIICNKEKALSFLLKEYNMTFEEVFEI